MQSTHQHIHRRLLKVTESELVERFQDVLGRNGFLVFLIANLIRLGAYQMDELGAAVQDQLSALVCDADVGYLER